MAGQGVEHIPEFRVFLQGIFPDDGDRTVRQEELQIVLKDLQVQAVDLGIGGIDQGRGK